MARPVSLVLAGCGLAFAAICALTDGMYAGLLPLGPVVALGLASAAFVSVEWIGRHHRWQPILSVESILFAASIVILLTSLPSFTYQQGMHVAQSYAKTRSPIRSVQVLEHQQRVVMTNASRPWFRASQDYVYQIVGYGFVAINPYSGHAVKLHGYHP